MPFPKLQVDGHLMTWNQMMIDVLKEASPRNRPKLWAIADLLSGLDAGLTREEFAVGYGIGGRQLRRWINRFNRGGVEGLLFRSHRKPGRKRKIPVEKYNSEMFPLIKELRASDGQLSGRKLWQLANSKFAYDIAYSGMMRTLNRAGIWLRHPREQLAPGRNQFPILTAVTFDTPV